MSAPYATIPRKLWAERWFNDFSAPPPNAQTLWLYLRSCDSATSFFPAFTLRLATIAEDLRWEASDVRRLLAELVAKGAIAHDEQARVVYLVPLASDAVPVGAKQVRSARSAFDRLPDCPPARRAFADTVPRLSVQLGKTERGERTVSDRDLFVSPAPPWWTGEEPTANTPPDRVSETLRDTPAIGVPQKNREPGTGNQEPPTVTAPKAKADGGDLVGLLRKELGEHASKFDRLEKLVSEANGAPDPAAVLRAAARDWRAAKKRSPEKTGNGLLAFRIRELVADPEKVARLLGDHETFLEKTTREIQELDRERAQRPPDPPPVKRSSGIIAAANDAIAKAERPDFGKQPRGLAPASEVFGGLAKAGGDR